VVRTLRVIADFHIHSKYSRATSLNMSIHEIAQFSKIKGLNLVGTGDFTHPRWLGEIKDSLEEVDGSGLYKIRANPNSSVSFILSAEVCTVFEFENKSRKIHHVILAPKMDLVEQLNGRLRSHGDLEVDGRPTLKMTAPELVDEVIAVSPDNLIFPAHAWTPWYSLFGANSGFDRLDDCYQDMTDRVHALETGLSSDPPMNWRLTSLDRLALLSNSDSHSAWPWRLGREANVFELDNLTYWEIMDAIKTKNPRKFKFTIETNPSYGKYHWTGHRQCNVSMPASEAILLRNICPKCGRKLTKGVEQRVDELADRPDGRKPLNAINFIHLLPLSEIIATTIGSESPSSPRVWHLYNMLIERFQDEYSVLLDASREEIAQVADDRIADTIIRVREGKVKVTPGYDGVYGRIDLLAKEETKKLDKRVGLEDFI